MDILNLIKKDRQAIKELFSAIESTNQTEKLYECFNKIHEELITYLQAEESTLYKSVGKYKENEELIKTAAAEHKEAISLLAELEFFSPTSSQFKDKLQQLKKLVNQHWEKEDNLIFVQAQRLINRQEKEELGNRFVSIKNKLQQELLTG